MRRFILTGLLFSSACLGDTTSPTSVATLQVSTDESANGVFVGDHVTFTAVPLDVNGNLAFVSITYASNNTAVATVSATGVVTAVAPGSASISVSAGSAKVSTTITVDGNIEKSIQLSLLSPSMLVGTQAAETATVLTSLGNPARGKSVIWSTTDATKVSVDPTGLLSAIAATTGVSICATSADAPTIKACTTVIAQ
jgi:uncharacterized protein YjdB